MCMFTENNVRWEGASEAKQMCSSKMFMKLSHVITYYCYNILHMVS